MVSQSQHHAMPVGQIRWQLSLAIYVGDMSQLTHTFIELMHLNL